jgi:hypothetical protein
MFLLKKEGTIIWLRYSALAYFTVVLKAYVWLVCTKLLVKKCVEVETLP